MSEDSFKQQQQKTNDESFSQESKVLEESIEETLKKLESLKITEIIQIYYKVINMSSMIRALKSQNDTSIHKLEKIKHIENIIKEKFNAIIHKSITEQLAKEIKKSMIHLKKIKNENKQKRNTETIKQEAKLFEKLREIMSTKEFVDQYNSIQ